MSRNAWIIFIVATIGVLAGLVYISTQNSSTPDVSGINKFEVLEGTEASGGIGDHTFGNPDSKVVLVEYVDYQCGGCAAAFPQVKSIIDEYDEDIAVVVRNFAFLQPHGMAAASAAEAAGLQGKYKEMAEVLFANQSSWSTLGAAERDERFSEYARNLGLDEEKFKADRASDKVRSKIAFDKALGAESGVTGTPAFFLNGEEVDANVRGDDKAFRDLIDAAIKNKGGTPPERESAE